MTTNLENAKDVCLGTKIRILKQITTRQDEFRLRLRCLSWHKDTNFKANHNYLTYNKLLKLDVCLGTKIRILKQITTQTLKKAVLTLMFVLAQRYEF